jgi:Concanavalin A-like lectin/glucanases superfamily
MKSLRSLSFVLLLVGSLLAMPLRAQEPLSQKAGQTPPSKEPGLLFYLSGDHGFNADYAAGGVPVPNFVSDVRVLPGGAKGSYLQCGNNQLLSYWAPGNIYAQRGTIDFDWRPREAVDETEFPVFRVGYADHSSWDMVWMRIDYNGHGFDAFVTDVNLGRTRVSYTMPNFPKPDVWIHLTLAWDETSGVRFYVNGKLAGEAKATGRFDAGLDQFGPHSRIISPQGVESTYNYDRGGDLDELRIYDRMLSDDNVAALARHEVPTAIPPVVRTLDASAKPVLPGSALPVESWQQEWWHRYGWNRPNDVPAQLPAAKTIVRKVQIQDAYDLKRWWYKGIDGIRETTWPGVYNRSKLPFRYDYFQLPDWDCYSLSGKSVVFYMPDEPWNHLEIEGGAWGNVAVLTPGNGDPKAVADPDQQDTTPQLARTLFERPKGQEQTSTQLAETVTGKRIRFTNVEQEWPIEEFAAYYVHPGAEPDGILKLSYTLSSRGGENPAVDPLKAFIAGRYPADERTTMVAAPGGFAGGAGAGRAAAGGAAAAAGGGAGRGGRGGRNRAAAGDEAGATRPVNLPIVHILIPNDFRLAGAGRTTTDWENLHAGLDGIAIDLPAMNLKPTHGDVIPMNIQIKDPIWPMRDMLDFNFSVKPGEAHTLWLDTRDRVLPNDKSLYLTIASASAEFGADALEGAQVRLIFKPYKDAIPEQIADRLNEVRDNYANMTEESVSSRKLNLYNRFDADISDLLKVDPENDLGWKYWHEKNPEQPAPPFVLPKAPAGVPEWAFLQVKDLGMLKDFIEWYIDNRQIANGEFGGGISDDSDFLNWWPGLAMMGADPDKLLASHRKALEGSYANDMWANGLAKAQYDELHAYEDGINMLGEEMQLDFGNPKNLERGMLTSKRLEDITGINSAGQRQIKTSYYSGTKIATGGVWGWGKQRSYYVYHPALQLVLYNGTPETRKLVTETADGFLAHYHADGGGRPTLHLNVNFHTNEETSSTNEAWFVLWAAYRWTGDKKYLAPFEGDGAAALRQINADALDMLGVRDTWGKDVVGGGRRGGGAGAGDEPTNQLAWQVTGDTSYLNKVYASQIETATDRYFINRQGSLWIDRIYFNNAELQRSRLGGVALTRDNDYPGNVVSWRFAAPANEQSVAILVPTGTPDHVKIIAYNLESAPVTASMTGWEIDPGKWDISQGTRGNGDNDPVQGVTTRSANWERSSSLDITFAPHTTTVVELTLKEKGIPYWSRPDLGIGADDVKVAGNKMQVTVHSLGGVDAPAARVVLRDKAGKVLATANAAALKAPLDLVPKTEVVSLSLPSGANWKGGSVTIEMSGKVPEITQMNNQVQF